MGFPAVIKIKKSKNSSCGCPNAAFVIMTHPKQQTPDFGGNSSIFVLLCN